MTTLQLQGAAKSLQMLKTRIREQRDALGPWLGTPSFHAVLAPGEAQRYELPEFVLRSPSRRKAATVAVEAAELTTAATSVVSEVAKEGLPYIE